MEIKALGENLIKWLFPSICIKKPYNFHQVSARSSVVVVVVVVVVVPRILSGPLGGLFIIIRGCGLSLGSHENKGTWGNLMEEF